MVPKVFEPLKFDVYEYMMGLDTSGQVYRLTFVQNHSHFNNSNFCPKSSGPIQAKFVKDNLFIKEIKVRTAVAAMHTHDIW